MAVLGLNMMYHFSFKHSLHFRVVGLKSVALSIKNQIMVKFVLSLISMGAECGLVHARFVVETSFMAIMPFLECLGC